MPRYLPTPPQRRRTSLTGVSAYNDDGQEILTDYGVLSLTPDAALEILISAFASEGYITNEADYEAAIVITVSGGSDSDLIEELEKMAEESLQAMGIEFERGDQTILIRTFS